MRVLSWSKFTWEGPPSSNGEWKKNPTFYAFTRQLTSWTCVEKRNILRLVIWYRSLAYRQAVWLTYVTSKILNLDSWIMPTRQVSLRISCRWRHGASLMTLIPKEVIHLMRQAKKTWLSTRQWIETVRDHYGCPCLAHWYTKSWFPCCDQLHKSLGSPIGTVSSVKRP